MSWLNNAFDFLARGGPVMVPLVACSIVALTVIIEKWLTFRVALADNSNLLRRVEEYLYSRKPDSAIALCKSDGRSIASMLEAGISNRILGTEVAERAMIERATQETQSLSCRLWMLDTIITIAPLLGLLGTVIGMIRSFNVMSGHEGIGTPTAITGGVAEALIATAAGLAVAIFTLIFFNPLNDKLKQMTGLMESAGNRLLNILTDLQEAEDEITDLAA